MKSVSSMRFFHYISRVFAPLAILFIAACSGGGGSTPDTTAPSVSVVSPTESATGVAAGTAITATFNEAMTAATISNTSFTLTASGSVTGTVTYDSGSMTATFTPASNLAPGTTYTATITTAVTDAAGNHLASNKVWTFIVADTVAPTVTSTVPADTATGVAGNSTVTATFSEAMDAATITNTTFTLSDSGSVSGTVTYDSGSMTATFTPASNLTSGTTYTATITTAVTDATGVHLASNKTWTFTVADTIAPTVSSTSPIDTATGVASSSTVTATFDEDMLATTIDGTSFTLVDSGSVSGTVSYTAGTRTATFTPDNQLHLGTDFTATLTTDITDLAGNPLVSTYNWSFTVDGSWKTAGLIETDDAGGAQNPQIAFDNNGNAIAVWSQDDGSRTKIMANIYTAGSGWGTAVPIETGTYSADYPQIAIDSNGNGIAVWYQSDGSRTNIVANIYTSGSGWGTEELIETENSGSAFFPQIAIDGSGNAIVVWEHILSGSTRSIMANRYVSGTGWVAANAVLIETDTGQALAPQIAIDAAGNAIAVWYQTDGTRYNIVANYYNGVTWGTAAAIENDNISDAQHPKIAFDGSGNAIAVWQQFDITRDNIMANRYVSGTGWVAANAVLIETDDNGDAVNPDIAMDSSGNAIVVWSHNDGTRFNTMANRYVAGSGWGSAGLIEADDTGAVYLYPQVAMDDKGNAIAVWQQYDGTQFNIMANRYTGGSWGTAGLIETDTGNAYFPQIAFDNNGNAIAVWQHFNTVYSIMANRFE